MVNVSRLLNRKYVRKIVKEINSKFSVSPAFYEALELEITKLIQKSIKRAELSKNKLLMKRHV